MATFVLNEVMSVGASGRVKFFCLFIHQIAFPTFSKQVITKLLALFEDIIFSKVFPNPFAEFSKRCKIFLGGYFLECRGNVSLPNVSPLELVHNSSDAPMFDAVFPSGKTARKTLLVEVVFLDKVN